MILRRRQFAALGLGCGLGLAGPAHADGSLARILAGGVLRAGITPDRYALAFIGRDGRPHGLAVAIGELLAQALGLRLELVLAAPQAERLAMLLDRRCDVLLTGPPINMLAARQAMFTDAFAVVDWMLVAPRDRQLGDASGPGRPRIATPTTGEHLRPGRGGIPHTASHHMIAHPAEALACIISGACDAAVLPDFAAAWLQEAHPGLEVRASLGQAWFGAVLRHGEHDLWRAVNAVLGMADAEGQLQILHHQFFGRPLPDRRPRF